jgi:hypothetical protein
MKFWFKFFQLIKRYNFIQQVLENLFHLVDEEQKMLIKKEDGN